jgi:hypothetical protein
MQQLIICEICYERPVSTEESQGFACKRHRFCEECWIKSKSCPFCRAPKLGVHSDLWVPYYFGQDRQWTQLRDDMLTRGLNTSYTYDRKYRDRIINAFKWAMNSLNGPLAGIFSVKELMGTVATGINKMTNFPIFAWKDKRHLEYDYDERFQKIEQRIMEILGLEGDDARAFRAQIRKELATVLRKIRSLAGLRAPTRATPPAGSLAQTPESRASFTSVRN